MWYKFIINYICVFAFKALKNIHNIIFLNGGEGGIRTLDWDYQYTISSRAPSASSDTSPHKRG